MYKLLATAFIAAGVAIFELTGSSWLRLGLELALGVSAVILGSMNPPQTPKHHNTP